MQKHWQNKLKYYSMKIYSCELIFFSKGVTMDID